MLDRAYFDLCLTLGRLLRSARYTNTQIVEQDGLREVRKQRSAYAPLLVWLGGPLVRILDTGVRVLGNRWSRDRVGPIRDGNAEVWRSQFLPHAYH